MVKSMEALERALLLRKKAASINSSMLVDLADALVEDAVISVRAKVLHYAFRVLDDRGPRPKGGRE